MDLDGHARSSLVTSMMGRLNAGVLAYVVGAAVSRARGPAPRDIRSVSTPGLMGRKGRSSVGDGPGAARPGRLSITEPIGRRWSLFTGRSPESLRDRRAGRWMVVIAAVLVAQPALGTGLAVVLGCVSIGRRRRLMHERSQRIAAGLADAIDILAVSMLSGDTVLVATGQISRWIEGEIGDAFDRCHRQVEQGQTLADALEALPDRLGPDARPLVAALVAAERYGAPIGPNLIELAADSRADRRRRSEANARRLPVTLLFPLVVCVLPAFLLVTVVPVVAQTFAAFDVDASPDPP